MAECKLCLGCILVLLQVCNSLTEGSTGGMAAPLTM